MLNAVKQWKFGVSRHRSVTLSLSGAPPVKKKPGSAHGLGRVVQSRVKITQG